MARIIGGIGASHTPTIGFAYDAQKQADDVWGPIFAAFDPVKNWLNEKDPDAIVYVYNDHVTSFFFDHYSAFALGIGDEYSTADEGGGPRQLPPIRGNPRLAHHIGQSLMTDEFDMSFFQDKPLDHGFFSPMSVLLERSDDEWPTTIVPLQVGVLQYPIPTAARCFKMGKALRRAIESYPDEITVAIVATGGLSHQVHGARAGFNNPEWDEQFLDAITNDPANLAEMTHAEYARLGGFEGAEVIMWLIMRGALSDNVRKIHSSYYLPSMTGIATLVLEDATIEVPTAINERHRLHMGIQLAGAEDLEGTHPFDLSTSVRVYRLNRFLHEMIRPSHRERFKSDPQASLELAGLSEHEKRMVRELDWSGLITYGVNFFMLEKFAAVVGASNMDVYAAMRGETTEDFLKTRNTPIVYSVRGDGTLS